MRRGLWRRRFRLTFEHRGSSDLNLDRGVVKLSRLQLRRAILKPEEKPSRVSLLTSFLFGRVFNFHYLRATTSMWPERRKAAQRSRSGLIVCVGPQSDSSASDDLPQEIIQLVAKFRAKAGPLPRPGAGSPTLCVPASET